MSKTINAVPGTIRREDYLRLIESVGFDVDNLRSLRFERNAIVAEVFALNERGDRYLVGNDDEVALDVVTVKVVDDE